MIKNWIIFLFLQEYADFSRVVHFNLQKNNKRRFWSGLILSMMIRKPGWVVCVCVCEETTFLQLCSNSNNIRGARRLTGLTCKKNSINVKHPSSSIKHVSKYHIFNGRLTLWRAARVAGMRSDCGPAGRMCCRARLSWLSTLSSLSSSVGTPARGHRAEVTTLPVEPYWGSGSPRLGPGPPEGLQRKPEDLQQMAFFLKSAVWLLSLQDRDASGRLESC